MGVFAASLCDAMFSKECIQTLYWPTSTLSPKAGRIVIEKEIADFFYKTVYEAFVDNEVTGYNRQNFSRNMGRALTNRRSPKDSKNAAER